MHACKHQAAAAGAMCTCMHVVGAQGESAARSWPASGIWHLGSGIWDLASGIWDLASGIWHLASGIWHLGSGIWHLGSGIWHLGSGRAQGYLAAAGHNSYSSALHSYIHHTCPLLILGATRDRVLTGQMRDRGADMARAPA